MDCFPGGLTSVDTDMTHDRCGETTIHYDTGLHDVKGSTPDVEQVEVDETIPSTGHLVDEDDNTQPLRNELGRQRRNVRLDDSVMGYKLENLALHSETLVASTVPGSAAEALADPNWKTAMQREYDSDSSMTRGVVSGFTANGATTDHWEVAFCGESQRGRQSDKVQGTFCGAGLHADTWLRLPRGTHQRSNS